MRLNKKTIIALVLCIGALFMAVGYSILQTELKITGGANITSSWDVRITSITTTTVNGTAYNLEEPSFTNDTAKFRVALVNPGDSMTYTVTIENKGTLTAMLNSVNIEQSGTEAIAYSVSGLKDGETLAAGATKTVTVMARYNSNVYADPLERARTLKIGLEWVQYTNQVVPNKTFTIAYNANGGTVTTGNTVCTVGNMCLIGGTATRTGYVFLGWSITSTGPVVYNNFEYINNMDGSGYNVEPGQTLTLYAVWGKITNFDYTGGIQTFTVPVTGKYRLEVWGAQGGNATTTYYGGYGGYSSGDIILDEGTILYVVVGGQGASGYPSATRAGGYNGGGSVTTTGTSNNRYVAGGGGATHMATTSGLLKSLTSTTAKASILIVAGGGGGGYAHATSTSYAGIGGHGGGYTGGAGAGGSGGKYGTGGTQSAAGYAYGDSTLGKGGFGFGGDVTASDPHGSAGGGGYYGGGASAAGIRAKGNSSGGGGSGFINNSKLTNKQMRCYTGCGTSTTTNYLTYTATPAYASATSYYAKMNNGYARITQLSV